MSLFHARWVLPIAQPPIRDGWVAVEGESDQPRSVRPGNRSPEGPRYELHPARTRQRAHPPRTVLDARTGAAGADDAAVGRAADDAAPYGRCRAARADSTWRFARRAPPARRWWGTSPTRSRPTSRSAESGLSAAVFRELLGFNAPDPEALVAAARAQIDALTPHCPAAPVDRAARARIRSSPALMRAIARRPRRRQPVSIHLGESAEEMEFLRVGRGAWRGLLNELGAWNDAWRPPACRSGRLHRQATVW